MLVALEGVEIAVAGPTRCLRGDGLPSGGAVLAHDSCCAGQQLDAGGDGTME
jgi:hypothetical protein